MKRLKIVGLVGAMVLTAIGTSGCNLCFSLGLALCCGVVPDPGQVGATQPAAADDLRSEASAVFEHVAENTAQKY